MSKAQDNKAPRIRLSVQIPPEADSLLEKVRRDRGWKHETPLVLEAIFSHFAKKMGKRERSSPTVQKYLERAKEFAA